MHLIGSLTSPYVRKVRIVMAEKKLDYRHEIEDVWGNDKVMKSNPLGKVPCLVLPGGEAIFDSRVIVEYLDTRSPVSRLIPETSRERIEVRTWEALADGVLDAAILARLEQTWPGRTAEQRSQNWIDRQLHKVQVSLAAMSTDWPTSRGVRESTCRWRTSPWVARWAYLDYRFAHIDWRAQYTNLARLAQKLDARPSFIDTLPPRA